MKTTLAVVLAVLLAGTARANGPEIGIDAGVVVPVASSNVELEKEWVDIRASLGVDGTLECMYLLRNRSHKARIVPMGFLVGGPSVDREFASHWDDPALGLEVHYPSGKAIPVRREAARKHAWSEIAESMPDSLPVFDIPIPADSAVAFLITSRISWSGGSDGENHGVMLKYVATPARLWSGPVGHAEIAFHFSDLEVALLRQAWETTRFVEDVAPGSVKVEIKPAGFTWTNDGVLWKFDHWEPRENPTVWIDWMDPASAE